MVPTPSVPDTSTGSLYRFGTSNSAPNPPMPPSTPSRIVFLANGLIAVDEGVAGVDVHARVAI